MNRTPLDCLCAMLVRAQALAPGATILRAVLMPETDGASWTWSLVTESSYGPDPPFVRADQTAAQLRMLVAVYTLACARGFGQAEVVPNDHSRYRTLRSGESTPVDLEAAISSLYPLAEPEDRDA
jgi:hypothetical protein